MNPITIAEAVQKLPELIDAALRGEEVIITKGDRY
jgi:antitoxin (DNA-binding transcriptional repressor) of toxin-antitoxin stability system